MNRPAPELTPASDAGSSTPMAGDMGVVTDVLADSAGRDGTIIDDGTTLNVPEGGCAVTHVSSCSGAYVTVMFLAVCVAYVQRRLKKPTL